MYFGQEQFEAGTAAEARALRICAFCRRPRHWLARYRGLVDRWFGRFRDSMTVERPGFSRPEAASLRPSLTRASASSARPAA
jgi:hypothetical protein